MSTSKYWNTPSSASSDNTGVTNFVIGWTTESGKEYRGLLVDLNASHYIIDMGGKEIVQIPRTCGSIVQILYD